MALPDGIYGRYKRATRYVLDWLLRARATLPHPLPPASTGVGLQVFEDVVAALRDGGGNDTNAPLLLPPGLLRDLPRVLAAGQVAITLRERVTGFFAATAAADDRHAHFLTRLRAWHAVLETLMSRTTTADGTTPTTRTTPITGQGQVNDSRRHRNYYEVLAMPDEFFDELEPESERGANDEEDAAAKAAASTETTTSPAERRRLFALAFAEDLELELVFFLMDLEALVEGVYGAFVDVKNETKTLLDAAIVTSVAIQSAEARVAALQLRYPSIQAPEDVLTLLKDRIPAGMPLQIADRLARALHDRTATTHIPGLFFVEFQWAESTLLTFTSAIPDDRKSALVLRDGFFGPVYSEEQMQQYVIPDPSRSSTFLLQQLPFLYNDMLRRHRLSAEASPANALGSAFTNLVDSYFETKRVSIPVVFASVCWLRAVSALQGQGGLSRHISVAIGNLEALERRIRTTIVKGHVRTSIGQGYHSKLEMLAQSIALVRNRGGPVMRANPVLTGLILLDAQLQAIQLAHDAVFISSHRLCAFAHLYHGLLDRGFLSERLPFVEDFLTTYEQTLFTPSRSASSPGSTTKTYLLSIGLSLSAVEKIMASRNSSDPWPPTGYRTLPRWRSHGEDGRSNARPHVRNVSEVYRLVVDKKMIQGNDNTFSASGGGILHQVARVSEIDIRVSRVLSRDLFSLFDDVTELFLSLSTTESPVRLSSNELDDTVMFPLLPFLDCVKRGGVLDTPLWPGLEAMIQRLGGINHQNPSEGIRQHLERAASLISNRFSTFVHKAEPKYFLFPRGTDVVRREFGWKDFNQKSDKIDRDEVFSELMDLMEFSPGKLSPADTECLKAAIRTDPELLIMLCAGEELCTLLHHAAAGPASDVALVEWMIQMGALHMQPTWHCRDDAGASCYAFQVPCNYMPIHCAAMVGNADIVRLLLDADGLRDLNTKTYHTKESIVHLATKHGHRGLYNVLVAYGADVCSKARDGKGLLDVVPMREEQWKQAISVEIVRQRRVNESLSNHRNRDKIFADQHKRRAEGVRRDIRDQCDNEHRQVTSKTKSSKKKSKKKKKKSKTAEAVASSSSPLHQDAPDGRFVDPNVEQLSSSLLHSVLSGRVDLPPDDTKDVQRGVDQFANSSEIVSRAFELLKHSSKSQQTAEAAAQALEVLQRSQEIIGFFVRPDRLNATLRPLRLEFATKAYAAIQMMNKYDRPSHRLTSSTVPLSPTASPAERLAHMCLMQRFFIGYIVNTAKILASCDRMTQARELFDIGERRLLAVATRPAEFGDWVHFYSQSRSQVGLGQATSERTLEQLVRMA